MCEVNEYEKGSGKVVVGASLCAAVARLWYGNEGVRSIGGMSNDLEFTFLASERVSK